MENILIVLVVIGSLIYKVYSGYKEEMDKAAKRKKPQVPSFPPPTETRPYVPTETLPPPLERQTLPTRTVIKKPIQHPSLSTTEIPDEVQRVQKTKQEMSKHKIVQFEKEKTSSESQVVYEFDLREAVIQSAILERPYKY